MLGAIATMALIAEIARLPIHAEPGTGAAATYLSEEALVAAPLALVVLGSGVVVAWEFLVAYQKVPAMLEPDEPQSPLGALLGGVTPRTWALTSAFAGGVYLAGAVSVPTLVLCMVALGVSLA